MVKEKDFINKEKIMINQFLGNTQLFKFSRHDDLLFFIRSQHEKIVKNDIDIQRMHDFDLDYEPYQYLYHYFYFLFDEKSFLKLIKKSLKDDDKYIIELVERYFKLPQNEKENCVNPCIVSLYLGENTRDYSFSFQIADFNLKPNDKDYIKDIKLKENVDLYEFLSFISFPCLMIEEVEFSHDFDIHQHETHYYQILSMKDLDLNQTIPNG